MKRLILTVVSAVALFASGYRTAAAMVEFCPAALHYQQVGSGAESGKPGALFGLDLSALGPRTITSATLAFDTSAGWFTVDVPAVAVAEKDRHYTSPWVSFERLDYVSPTFYAKFPQALTITDGWVYSVGTVHCDPPAIPSADRKNHVTPREPGRRTYTLDPRDEDRLSDPPAQAAMILEAAPSKPLETTNCSEPFRQATVEKQVVPQYPAGLVGAGAGVRVTSVDVAIEPNGAVQDAWVWAPSGLQAFDDAALQAARSSTYKNARAYCKDVPGSYFLRVTFQP